MCVRAREREKGKEGVTIQSESKRFRYLCQCVLNESIDKLIYIVIVPTGVILDLSLLTDQGGNYVHMNRIIHMCYKKECQNHEGDDSGVQKC